MPLPIVILPGYLAGAAPYRPMEEGLAALGYSAVTVPLRRSDWFPTLGGRSVSPILNKLDATVQAVREKTGSDRIILVGHSAGGWISRIYLGEVPYLIHRGDSGTGVWNGKSVVHTLVTLGTPHTSQERWTRRNLDFVNGNYPGAFHPEVRYLCVAGKSVLGGSFGVARSANRKLGTWFAYSSYELTCGRGNVWGDGITPVESAHLEGAENLTLENVIHSPRPGREWYGSAGILETWIGQLSD
jgi:pimeloyl-ACP methyl ester carboxylesterase